MMGAPRFQMTTGHRQQGGLLAVAVLIGAGAGLGAVVFRELIVGLTRLFSGHADYAGLGRVGNPHLPWLGAGFVLLTPVVAGLVYGPLVQRFAPEARGHGVPEVMVAVARNHGRIRPQVALVKSLASALCIGSGGSVGREGPIVQIGSALGSSVGQLLHFDERRLRLLVACGAAGGIAATFNAPLAGVFFAMELILRAWSAEAFGMVVLSSVVASVISRSLLGDAAFLVLPDFHVDHLVEYPLFAVLGLLGGAAGVVFSRVLYAIEDACDWAWRGPEWLRPAAGGLLLGGLLLALPEMYGVGYPVLDNAVGGRYAIAFLAVLFVGKIVACSLTIGIGGSGGVFAPSLFCGAALGALFGEAVQGVSPGSIGTVGAYALVGMGAVFAGAARAPITAVIILFELTGEYAIILPLMLAISLATGVSHLLSADTVYTRKLLRRGIDIDEPAVAALRRRPVGQLMAEPPAAISLASPVSDVARAFRTSGEAVLPVVDENGAYAGMLTAHDLLHAVADEEPVDLAAITLASSAMGPADDVGAAWRRLDDGEVAIGIADDSGVLVGWVRHRELLGVVAETPV
jgi:CIC family chloride channel protein